jgi:cation:H+ antiporter
MLSLSIFFFVLILTMIILIWSADKFVDGASGLARNLGLAPLIVGMLVVGFGTSAPEFLVSGIAALQNNSGLGMGNAIGSNITNIALVLGITAIIVKLPVHSRILKIELPILLGSGILVFFLIAYDRHFSVTDGWILAVSLVVIMSLLTYFALKSSTQILAKEACNELPDVLPLKAAIFWTIFGLTLLILSSKALVWSATNIAIYFGISDLIIGLTIIAIGTSLPELAASISSALKKETDLAVGTIIGSNIFNTLGVLSLSGIIGTAHIPEGILERDLPIMLAFTAILLIFGIGCWNRYVINRWKGIILLIGFIAYEITLYMQVTAR